MGMKNWENDLHQSGPRVVVGATNEIQSFASEDSSGGTMILGGSLGIGVLFLGTIVGLLAVQRRRKRAIVNSTKHNSHAADGSEYLVDTGELGLSLSQEDWKANSNNITQKDDGVAKSQ